MPLLSRISSLWRNLTRKNRVERDLNDEVGSYIELLADEKIKAGMAPDAARRAAKIELGGAEQVKEQVREVRAGFYLETVIHDLHFGLRQLGRNPGFTAVAVLTLALGIGANTMIFSVINSTLLKALPFPDPDRLVLIWETYGKAPENYNIVSAPNFWDFEHQSHSFESMAIFDSAGRGYNLAAARTGQEAEQVSGVRVSAGFFPVLGVKPLLGRTFLPEEETAGREHEVVLSYGLWQSRYGGDEGLIGKTIRIDGEEYSLIGVMPRDFQFQFWSRPRQLWVPVGYTKGDQGRDSNSFISIARLKPGVTVERARAEIEGIGNRLRQQFPNENSNMGATIVPLADFGLQALRTVMLILLAAVGFVLLIACVNVANLLLARGAARQKEIAIRRSLGASGVRIAAQLMTESMLLSLIGGVCGLLLVIWSSGLWFRVFRLDALYLPLRTINSIQIDFRVFAFALLVSGLTGMLFGIVPALSALQVNLNEPLKEGGRGSSQGGGHRLRQSLVAAEIALALIILCGAGLMIRSMARLLNVEPGFNPKNVLSLWISLPQKNLYYGPPDLPRFCQDLEERVGAVPGVVSLGAAAHLPLEGNAGRGFAIEGQPPPDLDHMPNASYSVACPGYFRTLEIPVIEGREFTDQDTLGSPQVIVITQTMAHKFWPKEDALGKVIDLGGVKGIRLTVVGIVGDVHNWGMDFEFLPQFFRPYTQAAWPVMGIVVRTRCSVSAFIQPVKKALAEALPDRPVSSVDSVDDVIQSSMDSHRLPMILLATFAVLALTLAAIGIAGAVGYSVSQRMHEIGIRIALGASKRDVLRLVVGSGFKLTLIGIAAGILGAIGLTRFLAKLLYGVTPTDPVTIIAVSVVLAAVSLLASYVPARRAAKVDPMVALRCE